MDKSIPKPAAAILDFIRELETGRTGIAAYQTIFGHNEDKLPKPITSMTLDEIEANQRSWSKRFGSSATGAYQFMAATLDAPKTLKDIEGEMGLSGNEIFTPDLQDLMGYHLLKRRGYIGFIAGTRSLDDFATNCAKEWASIPVLVDMKGAHRVIRRGESYYAGDGLNKSLTKADNWELVLRDALDLVPVAPDPRTPPPPPVKKPSLIDRLGGWWASLFSAKDA